MIGDLCSTKISIFSQSRVITFDSQVKILCTAYGLTDTKALIELEIHSIT